MTVLAKMYALFLLFIYGNVLFKPTFTQNITNNSQPYIIPDGGQAVIECHPATANAAIIKWEVFGKIVGEFVSNGDNLSSFNLSRNSTLIVSNLRGNSMQGVVNVTCIAYSNISTNVTYEQIMYQVTFYKAPIITNNNLTYDVPDDGSTSTKISCNVNGFPTPDIKWMFDNESLIAGQPYFINTSDIANANLTVSSNRQLAVISTQRRAGFGLNVSCIANNTNGVKNRTFFVRFLKAPKILNDEQDIVVPEGIQNHVSIPCQTVGYPRPTVHWLFGKVSLNVSHGNLLGEELFRGNGFVRSSYKVFANGTLRIDNTVEETLVPHKNFTCVASSFLGEDRKTHKFSIEKLISYKFVVRLFNANITLASADIAALKTRSVVEDSASLRIRNYAFTATRTGLLTVTLSWLKQDLKPYERRDENGNVKYDTAAIARDALKPLENHLNVSSVLMEAEPGPATNLSINEVTSSAISFSWIKPKYFIVTGYQIQFNEGGSGWKNSKTISGSDSSVQVDDLASDTKYLFRIGSINGHGVGIPSEVIEGKTEHVQGSSSLLPVVIAVVVILLILVAIFLGVIYYRRKARPRDSIVLGENNPYEFSMPGVTPSNIYCRGNTTFIEIETVDISKEGADKAYYSWREITRESLDMGETLGQGEFGLVVKAIWKNDETKAEVPVAVKTIKENATETDRKELFKELRLMSEISEHPNVVNLIGACSKQGPLWIIVELCEHGNLLTFLQKNRQEISGKPGVFSSSLDPLLRVRIAYDVSKGMRYLEEQKIVHRDLAARNVLLGKNKVAKISDFGLSRDIYAVGLYQKNTGGKVPVKWMAIESLKDATYTSKSDVFQVLGWPDTNACECRSRWSFGVLFWEIESAGLVPYPGVGGWDILDFLSDGFRLEQPSGTPSEIYTIMKKCWELSPKLRPHFAEIESELGAYLEERSDYLPVLMEEKPTGVQAYINYYVPLEDETSV